MRLQYSNHSVHLSVHTSFECNNSKFDPRHFKLKTKKGIHNTGNLCQHHYNYTSDMLHKALTDFVSLLVIVLYHPYFSGMTSMDHIVKHLSLQVLSLHLSICLSFLESHSKLLSPTHHWLHVLGTVDLY